MPLDSTYGSTPAAQGSMPSYSFRSTDSGQGNWNTGGELTGTGSLASGIEPIGARDSRGHLINDSPAIVRPVVTPPPIVPLRPVTALPITPRPAVYPTHDSVSNLQNYLAGVAHARAGNFPGQPSSYAGSTHYQTSGPRSGKFRGGDASVNYGGDRYGATFGDRPSGDRPAGEMGGGGGGGWRKGGNVDKPSVLKRIMARTKPKMAIDPSARATKKSSPVPARKPLSKVTQRVTNRKAPTKTPWKRGGSRPAFAKGGAVEKFMARYPNFKLA